LKTQCLTPEKLSRYLMGDLESNEKKTYENHLIACGTCRKALVMANNAIKNENNEPRKQLSREEARLAAESFMFYRSIPGRFRRYKGKISNFLLDIPYRLFVSPRTAYRSSNNSEEIEDVFMSKKIGAYRVEIQVEKTETDNNVGINVFKGKKIAHNMIIQLEQQGDIIGERKIDNNDVWFYDLGKGKYELNLSLQNQDIGMCFFEINQDES